MGADSEEIGATAGGEAAWVDPGLGYNGELLVWNVSAQQSRVAGAPRSSECALDSNGHEEGEGWRERGRGR